MTGSGSDLTFEKGARRARGARGARAVQTMASLWQPNGGASVGAGLCKRR